MEAPLVDRLQELHAALEGFVRRHAGGLLRFEEASDLVQGALTRALAGADGYEHRGEAAFRGWLFTIARHYLDERRAYWGCLKRGAGRVLRFTTSVGTRTGQLGVPAAAAPGPRTRAETREQLVIAIKALETLPERDQRILRLASEGLTIREQAERLGLGYDAAQRACHRATERFRKAFRLLAAS